MSVSFRNASRLRPCPQRHGPRFAHISRATYRRLPQRYPCKRTAPPSDFARNAWPRLLYSVPHWGVAALRHVRTAVIRVRRTCGSRGRLSTDLAFKAMAAAASGLARPMIHTRRNRARRCRGSSLVHISARGTNTPWITLFSFRPERSRSPRSATRRNCSRSSLRPAIASRYRSFSAC
jgi:hypothetical protein